MTFLCCLDFGLRFVVDYLRSSLVSNRQTINGDTMSCAL